nr:MAG TPA: protein-turn-helix DNA binding protein [Caudoviricetes sp.]
MRATGINQETMAAAIGLQQSVLSKKILGLRRWSLADLDRLADAGVPIHLTATTLDRETCS